jgi:hypothetical protein
MPWYPSYPFLNLFLWKILPALPPSFSHFCLAFDPSLSSLPLHPEPTRLNSIQVWRITWPGHSDYFPEVIKGLLVVGFMYWGIILHNLYF